MPAFLRALANYVYVRITAATARTADYSGTAFDTIDYDGTGKVALNVGAVAGTTPSATFRITESDTSGGTYTDISGATAAAITATGVREINVDVGASKRFIKVAAVITGTSPSFTVSEDFVGAKKYQ